MAARSGTLFSVSIPNLNPILVAGGQEVLWVTVQARLEEMDLLERLPAYNETMQQVGRLLPNLRLHKTRTSI